MTTYRRFAAASASGALLVALAGLTAASAPAAAAGDGARRDIATAKEATARFHDVRQAVAAGYHAEEVCVASPDGVMGYHYINPDLFGSTDPAAPGALLYVPDADGRLRLAGAEWLVRDADQDLQTDGDRPSMFDGVPFDGPMEGHGAGMPRHYDLHAWLWADNPAGLLAPWNPALSC